MDSTLFRRRKTYEQHEKIDFSGEPLLVVRRCRSAHMACPRCRKEYPLEDYIQKADKAMEDFLDNCYIDRL